MACQKLDTGNLVFAEKTISSEEATACVRRINWPTDITNGKTQVTALSAEKRKEDVCVKLEISY